jgi:hypothetical protein
VLGTDFHAKSDSRSDTHRLASNPSTLVTAYPGPLEKVIWLGPDPLNEAIHHRVRQQSRNKVIPNGRFGFAEQCVQLPVADPMKRFGVHLLTSGQDGARHAGSRESSRLWQELVRTLDEEGSHRIATGIRHCV